MGNDKIYHISLDYAKNLDCRHFGLSMRRFVDVSTSNSLRNYCRNLCVYINWLKYFDIFLNWIQQIYVQYFHGILFDVKPPIWNR